MKKFCKYLVFILIVIMMMNCATQNQTRFERKLQKTVKKEARNLEKKGWKTFSNDDIESELVKAYEMITQQDENGQEKYVFGEACVLGNDYIKTYSQAVEFAKLDLVSKIETEYLKPFRVSPETDPCYEQVYESLVKRVAASWSFMKRNMSCEILLSMYRELSDTHKEVRVMVFAEYDDTRDEFIKVVNGEKQREVEEFEKKVKDSVEKEFFKSDTD